MPYLFQKRGIRVIYKGSIFVQKSIAVNPQRICKCHRYIVLNGVSVILIQNQCRGHNANLFCQFPCGETLECPVILQILARCGAFFIGFVVKGQMNHDFAFRIEVNSCVIEITIGKAREYAPNIYEATKDYGEEVWLATYADGKNWGLPIMQPNVIAPFSDSWRMDYLEKVGITEVPTTLDEAEEAFLKIIEADVNENGTAGDTYGLTFRGKDSTSRLFEEIFSAFGVLPAKWMVNDDGTLTYGWMRDEIKDGLALLNRWYEMGIIDPEFVTTDGAIFNQKVANGSIVYLTSATWNRAQPPQGEFYLNAISGDPNAELVVGPALQGPNGDYGYNTWGSITSSTTFGAHLANDEEKLNLCLQVVDFVSANTDDAEYVRYGVEGTDWERNDVGAYVDLYADDVNKQAQFGSRMLNATPGVPELQARYNRTDDAEYSQYALEGTLVPGESYVDWVSTFTDSEITAISADIEPDFLSGIIDIITGTRPLDDYDTLRQQWYDAGGQELTDEYNRAYQEGGEIMDGIIAQIQ